VPVKRKTMTMLAMPSIVLSVRELEQVTGMSQSLVPYHLDELRQAGLVESTAAGRKNRYRLTSADLDQLATLLGRLQAEADLTAWRGPGLRGRGSKPWRR
jgi:DNA-binding transcriptional ArsR family regulator